MNNQNPKIQLEIGCELPIFQTILSSPDKILTLPNGYYEKFMYYILQEEMYEYIPKLESVKDRVSAKTLDEMLEDCECSDYKF